MALTGGGSRARVEGSRRVSVRGRMKRVGEGRRQRGRGGTERGWEVGMSAEVVFERAWRSG